MKEENQTQTNTPKIKIYIASMIALVVIIGLVYLAYLYKDIL